MFLIIDFLFKIMNNLKQTISEISQILENNKKKIIKSRK